MAPEPKIGPTPNPTEVFRIEAKPGELIKALGLKTPYILLPQANHHLR